MEEIGVPLDLVVLLKLGKDGLDEVDAVFSGNTTRAGEAELRDPDLVEALAVGKFDGFVDEFEEDLGVLGAGLSLIGIPVNDEEVDLAVAALVEELAHPAETLTGRLTAGDTRGTERLLAGKRGEGRLEGLSGVARGQVGLAWDVWLVEAKDILGLSWKAQCKVGQVLLAP